MKIELVNNDIPKSYLKYTKRKTLIILLMIFLTCVLIVIAINTGSVKLSPIQILEALLGKGDERSNIVVWNIRLPKIIAGIVAGAGLSIAGCVMQNILRNPLASPFTLGISQGAAFGAAIAIFFFGAGSTQSTGSDAVIINNPYIVTTSAFAAAMSATIIVLLLAKYKGVSAEAMILAGIALGSLFSAGTTIVQYFAEDVQIAAMVFWTFGDLGRACWRDVAIMAVSMSFALIYFMLHRWDYNALDSGQETAKGLGVEVEKLRFTGMFISSLITAFAVSFLGIIGFIGLVGPHIVRRIIGEDHRFLIPGASIMGGLLLLISDTFARTIVQPIVLPVGAVTSFMGAPLFLYLLMRGYQKK